MDLFIYLFFQYYFVSEKQIADYEILTYYMHSNTLVENKIIFLETMRNTTLYTISCRFEEI